MSGLGVEAPRRPGGLPQGGARILGRAPMRDFVRERGAVLAVQAALVAAVLVAWELAVQSGVVSDRILGRPSGVVERIIELGSGAETYGRTTIYTHILTTLQEIVPGYLIGATAGLLLGVVFARSAIVRAVLEPYLLALYSVPKIALAPVFILFFGIGIVSKIAIVIMGVFFMVFFNTYAGVSSVNEEYVNAARIMGSSRLQVFRRVVMPAAMPAIILGFKMGVPFAMIGAIVGEFIASFNGLGFYIKQATSFYDASGLMAGIVFLVVITWLISSVIGVLEGRVLRWQPRRERRAEPSA